MDSPPALTSPEHASWLRSEGDRLLEFGRAALHPEGGFAWLDEQGRAVRDRPVELWITCRMTHCYSLAHLAGRRDAAGLADHGVDALRGRLRDPEHGGWFAAVGPDGPAETTKAAYGHAFVVLAAASATAADRPGGRALLEESLAVLMDRFWDETTGMVVESWDASWSVLEDYRGVNANMHTVEAMLAAADVLDAPEWRLRAQRIVTRVVRDLAPAHQWRVPEHFDSSWEPLLDYHADEPAHPFRPYGATVGHWLEWARLALHLRAGLGPSAPDWLLPHAIALFDAAVREGWAVDGAEGFVYTVDPAGRPVVRQRMHWVVAEALAAAAALHRETGDPAYAEWYDTWWAHVAACFRDPVGGSWWHELSPSNEPSHLTWQGKPDIYHAYQATLLPRLPLRPTLAVAVRDGLLG